MAQSILAHDGHLALIITCDQCGKPAGALVSEARNPVLSILFQAFLTRGVPIPKNGTVEFDLPKGVTAHCPTCLSPITPEVHHA